MKERTGECYVYLLMQKHDTFIIIHNSPTCNNIRNNGMRRISRSSCPFLEIRSKVRKASPDTFHGRVPIGIHEFSLAEAVIDRNRARFKDLERQRESKLTLHRGVLCHGTLTCKRVARALARTPGINQKYEMRPAEFRYIYGGGQFNDTHSRSRVIVNISIRSTPTTHAYADKPRGQRCFMRVQGAFDSAMRRASCCHLFAHYITLLPSRVSPANLHYKCR